MFGLGGGDEGLGVSSLVCWHKLEGSVRGAPKELLQKEHVVGPLTICEF